MGIREQNVLPAGRKGIFAFEICERGSDLNLIIGGFEAISALEIILALAFFSHSSCKLKEIGISNWAS